MTSQDWNFVLESPNPDDWEAYVGLCEKDGQVTLRVPHGYPNDSTDDELPVHDKQQILGELTRAVMRFSGIYHAKVKRSSRDGFLQAADGQSFSFDSNGSAPVHTHLFRYVQLIRKLRDPRLLALTKTPGLTTQFDHRYIARNLERAMFLTDGTPVFENTWAPRTQMRHAGNDMVGLACWMALDALEHLFLDSADREIGGALQAEWEELKCRFADEHELEADASLFLGNRSDTLRALQAALEICVRREPSVSSDARELHQLLDELLHYAPSGHDGYICGLKGFHQVWESACLEYAIDEIEPHGTDKIFTCDDEFLSGIDPSTRKRWKDNRHRVFAKNGIARRPDLVIKKDGKDGVNEYTIVDFKYYAVSESNKKYEAGNRPKASKLSSTPEPLKLLTDDEWLAFRKKYAEFESTYKAAQDIGNIEAYRWLLMQYAPCDETKVTLELWVPGEKLNPGRKPLCWQARDGDSNLLGDSTKFNNLKLVYKPAQTILGAYAKKFRLMD
jgi:hypothetical protein